MGPSCPGRLLQKQAGLFCSADESMDDTSTLLSWMNLVVRARGGSASFVVQIPDGPGRAAASATCIGAISQTKRDMSAQEIYIPAASGWA